MASYRDDDRADTFLKDSISGKNLSFFLVAPALFGLFLLLTAERGSYIQIGIGVLLLASAHSSRAPLGKATSPTDEESALGGTQTLVFVTELLV